MHDILNSMERCEATKPDSSYCTILGVIGETYYKFIYYIDMKYVVFKDELYSVSEDNADALTQIYRKVFNAT